MMSRTSLISAGAVCACLLAVPTAFAQDNDIYDLVYTLKLDTGKQIEMPLGIYTGYPDCYRAAKKVEIGKVIPKGTLVEANGNSPSATIVSARCVVR